MCEGFALSVSFITAVSGLYTQIPVLQHMKLKCLAIRVMTAASIYIPSEERMFSRTCMLCLQVTSLPQILCLCQWYKISLLTIASEL